MYIHMYMYVCICTYICTYIHVYIRYVRHIICITVCEVYYVCKPYTVRYAIRVHYIMCLKIDVD